MVHGTGEHSASAHRSWYDIVVGTHLDEAWINRLEGLAAIRRSTTVRDRAHGLAVTHLTASVADQAALRGLMTALWDMNLTIVAVTIRTDDRVSRRESGKGDDRPQNTNDDGLHSISD